MQMKIPVFMKVFFVCCMLSLLLFLYFSLRDLKYSTEQLIYSNVDETVNESIKVNVKTYKNQINTGQKLKYILQWTSSENVPFVYMGKGQQGFIDRNCTFTNCFVTADRSYLGDYTKFDVIAFSGPEVVRMSASSLPTKRSLHQKFAFTSIESSDNYPVCSNKLDGVFNWTWTYKLDSEAKWGYIVVRDSEKNIIGPKPVMNWMKLEDMAPVSEEIKDKIKLKTKAVAWFVSNCYSRSRREKIAKELSSELIKYDLKVDVYGQCGSLSCSRDKSEECNKMIEKDYFFYLSFENSFAEDYVTEKLLYPLQHLAIPIVYGGANYTRFMPDGIYLDARQLGSVKLAETINYLIQNQDVYAEFFKWRNHYSFHRRYESIETDDYCRFCSILNEEETVQKITVYQNFREWWDPPMRC